MIRKISAFLSMVAALMILVVLVISVAGADKIVAASNPSSPSPIVLSTILPHSLPTVESPLGLLPTNCPRGPLVQTFTVALADGIGAYPAWVTMGGTYATLRFYGQEEKTKYGWMGKMPWAVRRDYTGTVVIHGGNLEDNSPLWFYIENIGMQPDEASVAPVLVRNDQNITADGWGEFPGAVYIAKAGCYYLEADWDGGSWRAVFTAGSLTDAENSGTTTANIQTATARAMPTSVTPTN